MHGEDDQIVPIDISSRKTAKLVKGATEIYYPGLPHGLTATHPRSRQPANLLAFCQQGKRRSPSHSSRDIGICYRCRSRYRIEAPEISRSCRR